MKQTVRVQTYEEREISLEELLTVYMVEWRLFNGDEGYDDEIVAYQNSSIGEGMLCALATVNQKQFTLDQLEAIRDTTDPGTAIEMMVNVDESKWRIQLPMCCEDA